MTTYQEYKNRDGYNWEELDWNMEYDVQEGTDPLTDIEWEAAITYDSDSIQEMFEMGSTFYHIRVGDSEQSAFQALIGISFTFAMEDDLIVATGRCHPAVEGRKGDYYTYDDEIAAERRIILTPASEQTTLAIKAHIAEVW